MKNYVVKTLMVSLPKQPITELFMVTLPDNAIPIGIEVRPFSMPEGLFLHHLIPCDENGNPIEEVVAPNIYETAWNELYKLFGERLEQDNLEVMDLVMKGVMVGIESATEARREAEQKEE